MQKRVCQGGAHYCGVALVTMEAAESLPYGVPQQKRSAEFEMRWNVRAQQWVQLQAASGKEQRNAIALGFDALRRDQGVPEPPDGWNKSQLSIPAQRWLRSQNLMEVADPLPPLYGGSESPPHVKVHQSRELASEKVGVLSPGTRLHILATCMLNDGTKRACVVLEGAPQAMGWVTTHTSDAQVIIHRYARPLYEVISPPKVRKSEVLTSKFVTQLPIGTRLHVVQSRRSQDAAGRALLRVCVRIVGDDDPIGWVTASKPREGTVTIREVATLPLRASSAQLIESPIQRPRSAPGRPGPFLFFVGAAAPVLDVPSTGVKSVNAVQHVGTHSLRHTVNAHVTRHAAGDDQRQLIAAYYHKTNGRDQEQAGSIKIE